MPRAASSVARRGGDGDLGARGEQRHLRRTLGRQQLVGAGGATVFRRVAGAQLGQVLPGQREHARRGAGFERELPALHRLDGIAGPEHQQVGDRPQRREMLDRLVGRAVLAEADRIVGEHMDHPQAHQRGEPDRRPHIVGEHQEGAGIGNDPAVQRHSVHRRGHAVLADAVMDEAAAGVRRGERRHALRPGVVGAGEVGGPADHFRHRGGERCRAPAPRRRGSRSPSARRRASPSCRAPRRRAPRPAGRRRSGDRTRRAGPGRGSPAAAPRKAARCASALPPRARRRRCPPAPRTAATSSRAFRARP